MSNQTVYNPWDTASNPPENVKSFYGEASINAFACMLVPGSGKVAYVKGTRGNDGKELRRYTAVEITVAPLPDSKLEFSLTRSLLAEFGEWKDTTWPSLKNLGLFNAQELSGKFVRVEQIPTGRKYQNKNGDEREATAIKFTDIYPDQATCLSAYRAEFGDNGNAPTGAPSAQYSTAASGNGNGSQKETALKFAGAFVKTAMKSTNGDLDAARAALAPLLAKQPLVNQYFTVDSPEIIDLMTAAL